MSRNRDDIVRSIRVLMRQVYAVSSIDKVNSKFEAENCNSVISRNVAKAYVTPRQISFITDELIKSINSAPGIQDRRALQDVISRSVNSSIDEWLNQNLNILVEEVVQQQLANSSHFRKREFA